GHAALGADAGRMPAPHAFPAHRAGHSAQRQRPRRRAHPSLADRPLRHRRPNHRGQTLSPDPRLVRACPKTGGIGPWSETLSRTLSTSGWNAGVSTKFPTKFSRKRSWDRTETRWTQRKGDWTSVFVAPPASDQGLGRSRT